MKTALEQLGYENAWHGSCMRQGNKSEIWYELATMKYQLHQKITRQDLERSMAEFEAVTDAPCSGFYDDFVDACLDLRARLSTQTPWIHLLTRWSLIGQDCSRRTRYRELVLLLHLGRRKLLIHFSNGHSRQLCRTHLGTTYIKAARKLFLTYVHATSYTELRVNAREVYRQQYRDVRNASKERGQPLLDNRLGDWWEPLCEFLDKPVPKDVQFPRANESAGLKKKINVIHWRLIRQACLVVFKRASLPWLWDCWELPFS